MIDIKAIKAAAEAATPGRLHIGFDNLITDPMSRNKVPVTHVCSSVNGAVLMYVRLTSDAEFVATANPATVLAMCNEIERLRHENGMPLSMLGVDQLRQENDDLRREIERLRKAMEPKT